MYIHKYICVYNNIHKINQNLVEIKEEYIGEVKEKENRNYTTISKN